MAKKKGTLSNLDRKNLVEWMQVIQGMIKEASGPVLKRGPFKGHSRTNPKRWLKNLVNAVDEVRPKKDEIDENIWIARVLGTILYIWSDYVTYAKSMDPRRPIILRKASLESREAFMNYIIALHQRKPGIRKVFSGQKWNDPYGKKPVDGTFI